MFRQMEKLLTKIIESWIIFWEWAEEIVASNILESEMWVTVVRGVCRGIKAFAEENWKTIEEVVSDILDEGEETDLYFNY